MVRLLLLTFSLCLFASGCISKEPRIPASSDKRDPWWGASQGQVETAICRQSLPRTLLALRNYFLNLEKSYSAASDGNTTQLFDLTLINQPGVLIRSLNDLLSPGPIFNSKVKQITNPKHRFRIANNCTSATCVAETIFGPTVGLQMLYLKAEFDLNSSPYSFDDSQLFTEEELWDIIATLELLPKNSLPFTLNQKLTRYSRGLAEGEVIANASIGFYDRWTTKTSLHRQYITFHEFAHAYSGNFAGNLVYIDQWLALAGWEKTESRRKQFRRSYGDSESELISKYAKTNPGEDFAESVSAYRLNPYELRSLSPERYNFIRDFVFDGIEFTHSEACKRKPFYQTQIESGKINASSFPKELLNIIARQCQPEYASVRFGNLPKVYYQNCVQSEGLRRYFQIVENRPVPQTLISEQYSRSVVKIHGLEEKITRVLTAKIAGSIWKTVNYVTVTNHISRDCKAAPWTTLNEILVEKNDVNFTRKPLAMDLYKVSPSKVEFACRQILSNNLPGELNQRSIHTYLSGTQF